MSENFDYAAYARELMDYIDDSPCAAWAEKNAIGFLEDNGFERLEGKPKNGGKYYIERGGTALAAFIKGDDSFPARIAAAHLDSPAIMLKPDCELVSEGRYVRLNSEMYGGAILSSWLDRPLGLAGRVFLRSDCLMPKISLIKTEISVCIVPNCAPHLNKELNKGFSYSVQEDMLPLFSLNPGKSLKGFISEQLKVSENDIWDYELYCYDIQSGRLVGEGADMISSPRLDDLMMCWGIIKALSAAKTKGTAIALLVDNEEVGSLTMGGARGSFPLDSVRLALGEDYRKKLKNTVVLSADMAHAVNPARPRLHEPVARPYINGGMVLKRAANKSYSTDGIGAAFFKRLCELAELEYQEFVNNSDRPGGSTIGPMLSAALGVPVADVGAPIMAMHSIRELGGVRDAGDSFKLFKKYFEV